MAAATWAVEIDWDKDGTFTDYTGYVDGIQNGLSLSNGAAEQDGSYRSGTLDLQLRNVNGEFNRNNSAAGTYGLMNERVPIRVRVTRSGTSTFWQGYITAYDGPVYNGIANASWITLRCTGALAMLADDDVTIDTAAYDIDGALVEVFDAIGLTVTTDYVTSDSDQAITLFFADGEKVQTVIRSLMASEMGGALFENKSGVITFKPRDSLLHGTADATWGDDNSTVYPSFARPIVRDRMADKVEVRTRTIEIGAGGVVVYQAKLGLQGPYGSQYIFKTITVPANQSIGPTVVSVNVEGVVGISGVPASTAYLDYVANSQDDGAGSDVTSSVTVTFTQTVGSGAYRYTITNTSGSAVYLTKFIIRAVPILDGSGRSPGTALLTAPTGSNDATVGTVAWSNPTRLVATDNSYATVVLTGGQTSNYLFATAFGAGVPSNATINGVAFEVECKAGTQTTQVISGRIIKGGVPETTVTRTVVVGTTEAYKILGASDDLWGTTLTPETVNASGFGVALYFSSALADTYSVDHVKMTIYFETQVGINGREDVYTAELAIPGVKGGQRRTYTLPWVDDATKARDYAQQMLRIARYPEELLELTFPWGSDAKRDAMIAAELYQLIAYQDTARGVSGGAYVDDWYRIIGLSSNVGVDGVPVTKTLLRPSLNFRNLDAIVWDDFDRADNGSALGNTPTGKAWTIDAGGWSIASNKARPTSTSQSRVTFDLTSANLVAECSLSNMSADTDEQVGLCYRYLDTNNYWIAIVQQSANVIKIEKKVSGVTTGLASVAWTPVDTAELRVVVRGNDHRMWVNRKLVIGGSSSTGLITDAALNTRTKAGFYSAATTVVDFDNVYAQGL